ncbi:MAG: DUF2992 family protein [Clostridiales bacterium]|nr:DUF2992 family protein [Clostridiales bacterium]
MDERKNQLTVYFEDPFWVGVLERIEDGALSVCKVTFGAEPKDYEVWDFILKYYDRLEFSPSVAVAAAKKNMGNPKRQQTAAVGIGTKAQQALQLQREERKLTRKTVSREQREAEQARRFALRQQKRKEKHRGH